MARFKLNIVCGLVAFMVCAIVTPAFAQESQYVIPKFTSLARSELVLSNLSNSTVTADVTFLDSATNQFARNFVTLLPNNQARLTTASFGLGAFSGSVLINTQSPISVVATVADEFGGFETVGPAPGSADQIIPFGPGTFGTEEIAIFNPSLGNTAVVIAGISPQGATIAGAQRTVEGLGTHRETLDTLFPATPFSAQRDISHIVVRAAANILAPERVIHVAGTLRNYASINQGLVVLRSDPALVPAVPVSTASITANIPYFVSGGGYETLLQVINTRNQSGSARITLVDVAGVPVAAPITLQLPPNGSIRENLRNLFNLSSMVVGSIRVDASVQVIATAGLGNTNSGSLVVMPSAPPEDTNYVFNSRAVNREFFSGLAFLNLRNFPVTLSLVLMRDDGTVVSRVAATVEPFSMLRRVIGEFFPEAMDAGLVHVASDAPIMATALEGRFDGGMLSNLAAMHSRPDFRPSDVTAFLATGIVRHNGAVLPNVGIQLTGPVTRSAITDAAGTYSFRDLPQGTYRLRPQAQGYTFQPPEIAFTITNDNSRNNDFAATLSTPVIAAVNPVNIVAGVIAPGSSLILSVQGGPFTSTSRIEFDGTPLPTTLGTATITVGGTSGITTGVSSGTSGTGSTVGSGSSTGGTTVTVTSGSQSQTVQQLTANIPGEMLAVAHLASVVVRTTGPGGSVTSAPATFIVGNPSPVIASFVGVPTPLVAGNPGFTITLTGTNFMPGVALTVNGVPRPTTFISSTQITGFVPPEDLINGGTLTIRAENPSPQVQAATTLLIGVFSPPAGISFITPSTVEARLELNAPPIAITVVGFGFKPEAKVRVDNIEVPTQFVSSTTLIGFIPPTSLIAGRSAQITVLNPVPSLPSEAVGLLINNLPPVLNALETPPLFFDPTRPTEEPFNAFITLRGANFSPTSLYEVLNTCPGATTFASGSAVWINPQTAILSVPIACVGTYNVRVRNVLPGGGVSAVLTFTVSQQSNPAAPTLTGLSPNSVNAGTGTFSLTIFGTGFQSGAFVMFGSSVIVPTSVTPSSVRINVPAFLIQSSGIVPIIVTNASATGASNRLLFTIN